MPRPFDAKRFFEHRQRPPGGVRAGAPAASPRPAGRSDAPGDAPIELPALALGTAFRFDASVAARLLRRDVNPKEAFTIRDASGVYYRASVKELAPAGGLAEPYERMPVSP